MWIERDISRLLLEEQGSYIQILIGPRQCGKSSLFSNISASTFYEVTLDDFQMRSLANHDPALFMAEHPLPLIIDEIQYAPNLFPELKRIIDTLKKKNIDSGPKPKTLIHLTGSNQILLDKQAKESLVGRASYYELNTLSVKEIKQAFPDLALREILFTGGWPELYTNPRLSPVRYLNDYIRSFLEKDIVLSVGITKIHEFHTVLGMLAARTGSFLNCSSMAQDSGVRSVTVKEWVSALERTRLIYLLHPFVSNLNKRMVKSPKIYFLDTGLAIRLQGWSLPEPFMNSPEVGHVFETLVLGEIMKYIHNHGKDWKISVWRTREGEEVDFLLENGQNQHLAIDAKLGIHSVSPQRLPSAFLKMFGQTELVLVSFGGQKIKLSSHCLQVPITQLAEVLAQF